MYAVRTKKVRSIVVLALDHELCARSLVTALISPGVGKLAMVARGTQTSRADEAFVQLWILRSSVGALERIIVRSNHSCARSQLLCNRAHFQRL